MFWCIAYADAVVDIYLRMHDMPQNSCAEFQRRIPLVYKYIDYADAAANKSRTILENSEFMIRHRISLACIDYADAAVHTYCRM